MTSSAIIGTLVLAGMCVLMWGLARIARKRMGIGAGTVSQDAIRVVGKRALDPKSSLYVVEIAGGRHILLGSGTDGTVTKLDDISAEEYAVMTAADEPASTGIGRPRLRVAKGGRATGPGTETEGRQPHDASGEHAGSDADGATGDEEPRFATVGESFGMLLGKARAARRDRASGE